MGSCLLPLSPHHWGSPSGLHVQPRVKHGFRPCAFLLSSLSVPPALVRAALGPLTIEGFDPGLLQPREKVPYSFSRETSEPPCRGLFRWPVPTSQSSIGGCPLDFH